MTSKTFTVRLNEKEQELFYAYASVWGKSIGDMMKNATLEKIEELHDEHIGDIDYKEFLKNPETYSLDEVRNELLNEL